MDAYVKIIDERLLDPSNDENTFRLLLKEFPHYPQTWIAYARYLHRVKPSPEETRQVLERSASKLRSLELWLSLIEFEVEVGDDYISKYQTLKAAVEDVGWDPRSLPLWDSFFALFVMLHNSLVKSLAIHSAESINLALPTSSTAPLGPLEASAVSFHDRSQVEDDDMTRFFTTADQVDVNSKIPTRTVSEALLRHPLRDEAVFDLPPLEVCEEKLRQLASSGDLNITVFKNHVLRFLLTPLIDLSIDSSQHVLESVEESVRSDLESVVMNINKKKSELFGLIPFEAFSGVSSSQYPELDRMYRDAWLRLLRLERSDEWQIGKYDENLWRNRMEYFFNWGCRVCYHIPDIWFERAQMDFSMGNIMRGLTTLETITNEKLIACNLADMALVFADIWELLLKDVSIAAEMLSDTVQGMCENNEPIPAYLLYHALVKARRAKGPGSWESGVDNLLITDSRMRPYLTEELLLMILSFELFASSNSFGSSRIARIIDCGINLFPSSLPLRLLSVYQHDQAGWLPRPIDFTPLLVQQSDLDGNLQLKSQHIPILQQVVADAYFFSTNSAQLRQWQDLLRRTHNTAAEAKGVTKLAAADSLKLDQLRAPDGSTSFMGYINFASNLKRGLYVRLQPENGLDTAPLVAAPKNIPPDSAAFQNIARAGHRVQQIVDILKSIVPSNELHGATEFEGGGQSPKEKAILLCEILERTAEKARTRKMLSPVSFDQLRNVLADSNTILAFERWFRFQQTRI